MPKTSFNTLLVITAVIILSIVEAQQPYHINTLSLSVGNTTLPHSICYTNPYVQKDNAFLLFMNGCYFDPTDSYILYSLGNLVLDWFTTKRICQALFLFLLILPYLMSIYDETHMTTELVSRYAHFLLQGTSLLLRVSLVMSMYPWMYAAFRQVSPCTCDLIGFDGTVKYTYNLGSVWSMPSGNSMVASVIGLHIAERYSILIGILVMLSVPTSCVFVGINSVGQVITGFAIGFVLHFYHSRTPLWMRFIDFAVTVIAGFLTLPLVKHFYLNENFQTFAMDYFEGLVWQVFSFMMIILLFSFGFLRRIITNVPYRMFPIDIQYLNMRLLPSGRVQEGEKEGTGDYSDRTRLITREQTAETRHEEISDMNGHVFSQVVHYRYVIFIVALLTYGLLASLSIATRFLDELLSFGQAINEPLPLV